MKKVIGVAMIAITMLVGTSVSASVKPTSTWQEYNHSTGTLIVYTSQFDNLGDVYFKGFSEDYDGKAVFPNATSSKYRRKQSLLREYNAKGLLDDRYYSFYYRTGK